MSFTKVSMQVQQQNPFKVLIEMIYQMKEDTGDDFPFSKSAFQSKGQESLPTRNGIITHHDNTSHHTAQSTKDVLEQLGLRKNCFILHILPSLLLLIITRLAEYTTIWLVWHQEVEHELFVYFASKAKEFFLYAIYKLVNRGNEVLGSNGNYFND